MQELLKDMQFGARLIRRAPWFAGLVVLTLALGIGANTAIFSLIRGVLLEPLPYLEGERLVLIKQAAPGIGVQNANVSIKEYFTYREQARDFESLVEHHQMSFDLLNRGEPDRVTTGVVSHNFFDVLGVKPIHGRTFAEADDKPGAEAVLVLSNAYWKSRFGGDPSIIGQVFEMNDRPHTVVGVLPAVPHYPNEVDIYMPTSACPFRAQAEGLIQTSRRPFNVQVFGLLKDGVAPEAAAIEVAEIGERFKQDFPQTYRATAGFQAKTANLLDELTVGARQLLLILLGTTGLILVIACANVANLTLARMVRRDLRQLHEVSRWTVDGAALQRGARTSRGRAGRAFGRHHERCATYWRSTGQYPVPHQRPHLQHTG